MATQKQILANVADNGKVRLGGASPNLPIRIAPASVADNGKVRIGGSSPALPPKL